jgi:hypothetical protein
MHPQKIKMSYYNVTEMQVEKFMICPVCADNKENAKSKNEAAPIVTKTARFARRFSRVLIDFNYEKGHERY